MSFIVIDQDFAHHIATEPTLRVRHLCVYADDTDIPSILRQMSPTISASALQQLEPDILRGWGDLIAPPVNPQPLPEPLPEPEPEPVVLS
mgnify:CR=1 FL=1